MYFVQCHVYNSTLLRTCINHKTSGTHYNGVVNSATCALPDTIGACSVILVGSCDCVINSVYREFSVVGKVNIKNQF